MSAITANCAISLNCELTQPVKVQYIDGNMFSMDNAGNTAHVYVFYNGEPQEISGSISATVIRSDGTTVAITGAMSGNRAYVIFPQSCYAVPGVVSVVIKVTEGTTVTTIAAFVANVYRSSTDTIVDPGTIIPSVQNLISAIETAVASIPADYSSLWESLAPDYTNITFPVTAGKYCTYNGTLYVAKVDIATTESFTAAHWQSTNIGDNLSALKSAIELKDVEVAHFVSGTYQLNTVGGDPVSDTPASSTSMYCYEFECEYGDIFQVSIRGSGTSSGGARAYGFLNSSRVVLSMASKNATLTNGEIVAPAGAAYLVINTYDDAGVYAVKGNQLSMVIGEMKTDDSGMAASIDNNAVISFTGGKAVCGWETGGLTMGDASKTATDTRIRTREYLDKSIRYIKADTSYAEFGLLAFNSSGVYQGCWNGSALTTTTAWITSADLKEVGDYNFMVSIRNRNDDTATITTAYADYLTFATEVSYEAGIVESCFRGEKMVSSSSGLSDFNDAVINRYYSINATSGISNMPVAKKGHLLYFGLNGGSTTVQSGREVQMYITHDNEFWYRGNKFSSGAPFADWRKLAAFDEVPFPGLSSLSMFQSIGIIGDSFASGEIYDANAGTHADYYPLSWGQVLARMCGMTAVNYSKGGLTSKSWLTNTDYGLTKLNADPAKNLYIIALGINDANHSDTIPVGSSSDITSDDTASFYSYYGRIIRAIKAHAPSAVIMLSTLARFGNTYNPYSEAVRTIGEYYDLIVLDLAENDYFQSSFFSSHQISNHPTAVNYSGMAKAYKDMIEKAIDANASDFDGYVG